MSEFIGWLLFAVTFAFIVGLFLGVGIGAHHDEKQWRVGMRRFAPGDKGLPLTRDPQ